MYWIEHAPLAWVALAIMAGLVVAHEAALRLGRRIRPPSTGAETRGYIVSSALSLLGLLMAFTFSAAQDRFRLRQDLVVAEANAIGTSYLRVQLLDPPWRDELSRQLLAYAEARAGFGTSITPAEVEANARRTAAIQARIWRDLGPAVRANSVQTLNPALVQTLNETFDLAEARRAAREARVPLAIVRALIFCSLTVAAIVGYTEAVDRRYTGVVAGVLLLVTLALCLILDLDRPVTGRVLINQAPLQRALESLRRSEAAKAAPPAPPAPPAR